MLPPVNSTRACMMFIRHVQQPLFRTRKHRASGKLTEHSGRLLDSGSSNPHNSISTSLQIRRQFRDDFVTNGSLLSPILRFRPENVSYLRCSSSYDVQQRRHFHYGNNQNFVAFSRRRMFVTSAHRRAADKDEAKSKVERTLSLLKEELEARERETKEMQRVQEEATLLKKKPLWRRFMDECIHYYHGFRLLGTDFRVSARLLWEVVRGHTLSRKERRQLIRSVSDLFRLVPFLIFVIVPFMEFALPIFLKLFPGMLPSTFQEQSKETEKVRKQLKVKLEMAKFLQATMEELSLERKQMKEGGLKVQEFSDFLKKIREERGGYVSNAELLTFSKLFEDELTLDNLSHAQLRALCRIVGIQPIGTSNMLRFQLNMKLRELKADDKLISAEGIDTLSILELQQACRARGMRSIGVSEQRLKSQLTQWLELSLNEQVPPSLLLLSSTLYLPEEVNFSDRLATLLGTLPEHLSDEVKLKLSELEGAKVDNKVRLEIVKSIEGALKKEREEEEQLRHVEAQKAAATMKAAGATDEQAKAVEELIDKAPTLADAATAIARNKEIDLRHLEPLEELLSDTARGKLSEEKEDLQELKRGAQDHKEGISEVQALMVLQGGKIRESKAAKRLQSQVDRMISKADRLIDKLREEKQQLTEAEGKKKDIVFINDMLLSLRRLQKLPDDTKLQGVVDVLNALDEDHDGAIDVNLALQVIELLGQDNVKISHDQMSRICALLKKEHIVDEMEQVHQQQPLTSPDAAAHQQTSTTNKEDSSDAATGDKATGFESDKAEKREGRVAQ